jgi:hypothetical protein
MNDSGIDVTAGLVTTTAASLTTAPSSGATPPANPASAAFAGTAPAVTNVSGASTSAHNTAALMANAGFASIRAMDEILQCMRYWHPTLFTELDRISEEISKRFKNDPEEDLQANLSSLFMRCFKTPFLPNDEVPQNSLQQHFERQYRKLFGPDAVAGASRRQMNFIEKYRSLFERDFLNKATTAKTTTELLRTLKYWRVHLLAKMERKGSAHLKLYSPRMSPALAKFFSFDVEIPGIVL